MKTVLISGSGIAGLTTAFWLAKDGWEVTIIEKSKAERTDGYMMDFFGNGWNVAERMGITDKIKNVHYPIDNFQFVNKQGKPYFTIPIQRMILAYDDKYRPIRRPDLEHILLQEVKKLQVSILYNTTVTELENTEQDVIVTFNNGEKRKYDIVVGADGVHSNIRRLVFGDESQFTHYLGYILSAFHLKRDKSIGNNLCLYQEPNRQFGIYPYSEDEMDTLFIIRSDVRKRIYQPEYKDLLLSDIKGMGWKGEAILKNTKEENVSYLDTMEQVRMKQWYKNRVVLVGDASACPTSAAGQGASMAMTEAYVLAQKLRELQYIDAAFEAYQAELFDFVLDIQKSAKSFAKFFVPKTMPGVMIQRWFTQIALSKPFIKKSMTSFIGKKIL